MSTQTTVSAVSTAPEQWHQIDWARVQGNVRRLQIRIVKATQAKDWRRVKALQRFLTRSFCGKAIAVRRVTENQGRRTPGIDRQTWSTPDDKWSAIGALRRRGYKAQPLKRVYIPKANGQKRPLGIPTMRDRAMQALHLLALAPIAETTGDSNSYGFRPARSTADAIKQCHTILSGHAKAEWVLEGDIRGCFDHISHDWLLAHVRMDKGLMQKWLKAGYIELKRLFPTVEGTPQGGIISPTLANLALDGLESVLEAKFGLKGNRKAGLNKVNLVRYADDFVITGSSKELLDNEVKPIVEAFLATRGLELSQDKTRITHVSDGFDFLGTNIRKFGGAVIITPSKKNIQAFKEKIKEVFRRNRTAKQENLIKLLNPIILGWTAYHRSICASQTFSSIDAWLWWKTWRWAKRRHPNKPSYWVKGRYFGNSAERSWVFMTKVSKTNGDTAIVKLAKASDTKIRRHTKIRGDANPFDPQWDVYFEDRLGQQMNQTLEGRNKLLKLWWRQDKRCPLCVQLISSETKWHVHHLLQKEFGGTDAISNLVLLHPNCHRQLHANGWTIE